ncbi:MAG: RNA-processing protein [Candidatus Aenigmarchaeota archaeon]|nr:RNA-processing protein [Candidatus Aenigmarchaeota archaeon]
MIKKLRIPKVRVKILEETKKRIDELANVSIKIDDGEVTITGDSLNVYIAERVVKAIGRGFKDDAFLLLDENYVLYVIPISKNKNTLVRMRGRLIGTHGKIKERIEKMTNTKISIYGKTVSIIGKGDDVERARHAVQMILDGRKHATVFVFLEKTKRVI